MNTNDAVLKLEFPSKPHLCRVARERVVGFALAQGVSGDALDQFLTALGEALANAIEHGRSEAPIRIECRISRDRILGTVIDDGVGFPGQREVPDIPDVDADRGRGLPIMRRCTDIFSVSSAPGRGTAVTLGCYLRNSNAA